MSARLLRVSPACQSSGLLRRPERGHAQSPLRHDVLAFLRGIEFGVSTADMLPAALGESISIWLPFGQKSQAFESRSVAQTFRVPYEHSFVTIVAAQVVGKAVGDVVDATADRRVVEHVDNRAVHVRYRNARTVAPDVPCAEELSFVDMLQR